MIKSLSRQTLKGGAKKKYEKIYGVSHQDNSLNIYVMENKYKIHSQSRLCFSNAEILQSQFVV